jgi:folate-binding protein YgfZ
MAVLLDRASLRASGPDAAAYLQSMVSNDIDLAAPGHGVYALLLTPKARVIADLEIFNVDGGFVLSAPAERRDDVLAALLRSRFRRKVDFEPSEHAVAWLEVGENGGGLAVLDTPAGPHMLLAGAHGVPDGDGAWEIARVEAGLPRFGREFDTETMPAEAGLDDLAVSFTKGCYPGQEPVARLRYRGRANRGLRGLELRGDLPEPGAAVRAGDREVGRVTSPVVSPRHGPIALAIVRREVADGDEVDAGGTPALVRPLPFGG